MNYFSILLTSTLLSRDTVDKFLVGASEFLKSDCLSRCLAILFLLLFCTLFVNTYDINVAKVEKPSPGSDTNERPVLETPQKKYMNGSVELHTPVQSGKKSKKHVNSKYSTPFSTVSTLTPDSNYRLIRPLQNGNDRPHHMPHMNGIDEDDDDGNSDDGDGGSEGSSISPSENTMMSGFSRIDFLLYESEIMTQSVGDPKVLVGWRIMVKGIGSGTVLSVKRVKFSTSKFVVQFDTGAMKSLALRRSETKGKVPFTLIGKSQ